MKITYAVLSVGLFAFGATACDFAIRTGPGAQTPSRTVAAPPPAPAAAPPAPASTIQTRTIKRPQIKMPDLKNGVPASTTSSAASTPSEQPQPDTATPSSP